MLPPLKNPHPPTHTPPGPPRATHTTPPPPPRPFPPPNTSLGQEASHTISCFSINLCRRRLYRAQDRNCGTSFRCGTCHTATGYSSEDSSLSHTRSLFFLQGSLQAIA